MHVPPPGFSEDMARMGAMVGRERIPTRNQDWFSFFPFGAATQPHAPSIPEEPVIPWGRGGGGGGGGPGGGGPPGGHGGGGPVLVTGEST